jgi:hypothetical protein
VSPYRAGRRGLGRHRRLPCGAYVTAPDLDRFLRAVQAGELLSPALTEAFLTPQVPYQAHSGWNQHFPRVDISVVLLSNMEAGVWEPVWKIHNVLHLT